MQFDRDGTTYECVKRWRHGDDHEFVKVEKHVIRNVDFEPDVEAIRDAVNEQDNRYHYSTEAIRVAVFQFVCEQVDQMLQDVEWHWDHHNGDRCLGKADIDLGPMELDPYCVEASCC